MNEQRDQMELPITKNVIKEAISEDKKEMEKLEERKRNIILFNAKEPKSTNTDEAKKEDYLLFHDICDCVDESILEDKQEVVNVICLGKKRQTKFGH